MKKITSIFALLLCVFVFSCSNDDDKETSSLQIVSSNVTFESAGGTGTIKVNAISEITATSNKDWCTVSVNGDIINVSVIENNDMSGRTAICHTCAEDKYHTSYKSPNDSVAF